jgi:pimeloyl-ACP methyl ester carboxylesterase
MTGAALSDEVLVRSLPGGFENAFAEVNGARLHYVVGGAGRPLVLLAGWPRTWWEFHKIMPSLVAVHRVIAVDIRGMGTSDKPEDGYDKKTMATDIHELARHLGHDTIDIVGHDIGAMVSYSLAANYPDSVGKVVLLDVPHPHEGLAQIPLLPQPGQQIDPGSTPPEAPYLWWFAFNQVRSLPEQLLAGRTRLLIDWLLDYLAVQPNAISEHDRSVYPRTPQPRLNSKSPHWLHPDR